MKAHSSNLVELKDDIEKASVRELSAKAIYDEMKQQKKAIIIQNQY